MMKLRMLLMLAAGMSILVLATCSKSDGAGGTSGSPTKDFGGSFVDAGASAADIVSAQREVVNVGIEADVADFNPWSFNGVGANQALWGLYQCFGYYIDQTYYPVLMERYKFSEDGMSLDCELYEYIRDWEGNPITADDVLFSWNKLGEVLSEFGPLVRELVKTGEYSFTFHFSRPLYVGEFENIIKTFIVSKTAFENSRDAMHTTPVGTGPYKLTKYTSGYMFTYEKVDSYWQTDKSLVYPRDMANVNTINYYVITESSQRTIALERGMIDICGSISSSALAEFDRKNGYRICGVPDNLSMSLFGNCDASSPCSDVNLRIAICYAISNHAILESVYGGMGSALYELTPAWAIGYNEAWDDEDNYYRYNPEEAAQYLAQSSYAGQTLKIICAADERSVITAQLVQNFLGQIGVKSDVSSYESTVFKQYIQNPAKWDIQLSNTPTTSGYYVQAVYSSFAKNRWSWGGSLNFVFDERLQELLDLCMPARDASEGGVSGAQQLEALHRYIIENCYAMGMVNIMIGYVVPDWLKAVTLSYRKTIIPGGCVYD
jgi:peptide/nickel transport system substrate-binding protein